MCRQLPQYRSLESKVSRRASTLRKAPSTLSRPTAPTRWWYKTNDRIEGPFSTGQIINWTKSTSMLNDVDVARFPSGPFVHITKDPLLSEYVELCPQSESAAKKETKFQRVKRMFREYGTVFVVYYGTLYLGAFVPLYVVLEGGFVDCISMMEAVGVGNLIDLETLSPGWVNFFVAVECNDLIDLVRLPFVVATTPKVARMWRERRERL